MPDAFLRRCFFHYINFPDTETLKRIVDVHLPGIQSQLVDEAISSFLGLRGQSGLKKKPSTSELIDWLRLLVADDLAPEQLKQSREKGGLMPLFGALLKNEQDVALLERLAFMTARR